jgi:hypothetical protein
MMYGLKRGLQYQGKMRGVQKTGVEGIVEKYGRKERKR